jgi:hypothetical protein
MVTKCANPSCTNLFRYLRGGKVFLIDTRPPALESNKNFRETSPKREYFWLCERCSRNMSVALDQNGSPVTVRRPTVSRVVDISSWT